MKNNTEISLERSSMRSWKKSPKIFKIIGLGIISFLIIIIILGVISYFPAKKTIDSAKEAINSAQEAYALAKKQDVLGAGDKIKITKTKLETTKKNLRGLSFVGAIPFIGNYYRDANHLINSGIYGAQAGDVLIEAIKPHADLLGLKGQGSFVGGSAEERIQKTVQTMDKITPEIDKIEEKLNLIKKEIDQIDPKRYPDFLFGKKVQTGLTTARNLVDESTAAISQAKPLIVALPKLMGEPTEKKYLILFQNDKELRATGGFITAFAIFRLEHGKIFAETSEDIYKLDNEKTRNTPAPDLILKYLPLVPYWNLRDSNTSPDFIVSMRNFAKIYQYVPSGIDYDGIIAIDTNVLLKIMEVLGPIEVYGAKFITDNDPRCNCPQVIYELERYADQPVGYERGSRKDLIGRLMYAIMQKSLSSSPKLYWGKLFQTGLDQLNQKHILLFLKDAKAQEGAEALNFSGRIKESQGDYLHINDTNFAGAKSNMYVKENVNVKYEKQSDGSVVKTLIIKYNNSQPASNCNLEAGELCLNGLLRNVLRVYVPKGSELLEAKGSEVKIKPYEELGKTVYEGFLIVRPMGSAQVTLKYKLPFKVEGNNLKTLIQKQPGTMENKYIIESAGKTEELELATDKEVKVNF